MHYTEHYQLNQWEANDKVQRIDFNRDNEKIDGALHRLAQEKAERSKVEKLQSALAGKGNCRIATGTYVGTGKYDSPYPNRLTFDGIPLALFVGGGRSFFAVQGIKTATSIDGENPGAWVALTWSGNQVSWYNNKSADRQLNQENRAYHYAALLAAE